MKKMIQLYHIIRSKYLTKNHKVKYTVTGYGVAYRKADNYLSDPFVMKTLESIQTEK